MCRFCLTSALPFLTERSEAKPRPKQLSTRALIQRDRALKRLSLYSVEELPKPVLVECLQDACLLLECRDALKLCAAITPVQDRAALVPRMERWIGDVCAASLPVHGGVWGLDICVQDLHMAQRPEIKHTCPAVTSNQAHVVTWHAGCLPRWHGACARGATAGQPCRRARDPGRLDL